MARTSDITSFTEYRRRLREHLRQVRETGRPLFVTTNGRTDAVVMSPDAYDALMDKAELVESLVVVESSLDDIHHGRTEPAAAGLRRIAEDLGLTLDR